MKSNIPLLIFMLINLFVNAQNETKHWCFGGGQHLLFDTSSVQVVSNCSITTPEAASSISDSSGNLLFYTNGEKIWNKLNQVMQNGNGLNGNWSATQCLIVKHPLSDSLYYIFYADGWGLGGAYYAIVDMSFNSGLGSVVSKNNLLFTPSSEKFSAIKNSNDTDVWVMTRTANPTFFKAYLLTTNGLNLSPVTSNIGIPEFVGIGQMKFSHNGKKLALANVDTSCFELFDFNASSGIVSNAYLSSHFTTPNVMGGLTYGVEFSPNDSILYCTLNFPPAILKYDLTVSGNPLLNYTMIDTSSCFSLGALQLALDGNIYVGRDDLSGSNGALSVIHYPNSWNFSNYIDSSLALNNYGNWSLPNFEQSLFRNVPSNTPTSIQNISSKTNFSVYPNPFTSQISISVKKDKEEALIIRNTLGQVVYKTQERKLNSIDLSFLSKGIYLLDIIIDGERTMKKIVKD